MKIVCDSCQAKYSIADEKIQGKAFKIRCKKCNHIIVVKTASESSPAPEVEKPRAAEAPVEQAVWHVVVNGEQVGPISLPEVKEKLNRGEISAETLVWKDGLADWVPLSTIQELASILPPPAAKPVSADGGPRQSRSIQAVAPAADSEGDVFAAPTVVTTSSTVDLFSMPVASSQPSSSAPSAASAMAASSVAAQQGAPASSPFTFGGASQHPAEPAVVIKNPSNASGMTGQRNENSVLFSLSNLEALATPSQAKPPSTTSTTEGSGLIDIRSMAAMTLSSGSKDEPRASADSLPTFSTPQFNPVAPVLLPTANSGPPKWVYPVLGVIVLGICVMLYLLFKAVPSAPPPPPPPQVIIQQAPAPQPVVQPVPPPAAAPTAEQPKDGTSADQGTSAAADKPSDKPGKGSSKSEHSKKRDKGSESKSTDSKKPSGDSTSSSSAAASAKKGSSDDLFADMKKAEAPKPPERLVTLTRGDIVSAMTAIQPKIQACANQFKVPGTAMANISVAKGGKVGKVEVTGKFAGSPTGACVESAAKSAKFPACEPMTFPFPFTLAPR